MNNKSVINSPDELFDMGHFSCSIVLHYPGEPKLASNAITSVNDAAAHSIWHLFMQVIAGLSKRDT